MPLSDLVRQTGINEIADTIGQYRHEPGGKTHQPGKSYQSDVFFHSFRNDFGCLFSRHEKGHRAGVLIGNARFDKARADDADLNAILPQFRTQCFAIGFDTGFGGAVRRAGGQAVITGDGRSNNKGFVFVTAIFEYFDRRNQRV